MKSFSLANTAFLAAIAFAPACQDAQFAGTGGKKKSSGKPSTVTPNTYDPNTNAPFTGTGGPNNNINIPGDGTRTPLTIDFGSIGKIWHIGDGAWNASKCKVRLTLKPFVRGEQFNFNFTVQEDNTNLSIQVKHCGVDYAQHNFVQLIGPQSGQPANLPLSQNLLFMSKYTVGPLTLNRGNYKIRIISTANPARNNDLDDFIVGDVEISPNKPVVAGDVTPY